VSFFAPLSNPTVLFRQVEVLSTITREERKLFVKLHEVQAKGTAEIVVSLKIAHLALRHRQNRNQKMRIVMFIGSPIKGIDKPEVTQS
jgi:26S proteasome regulatory subunit N10